MRRITLLAIAILILVLPSCAFLRWIDNETSAPQEGVWYCEELQLELSFDDPGSSAVIVDGERTACSFENDRGSSFLSVAFLNEINHGFDYEQIFFRGICNYKDDEKMLVTEALDSEGHTKGKQYTFVRVK